MMIEQRLFGAVFSYRTEKFMKAFFETLEICYNEKEQ